MIAYSHSVWSSWRSRKDLFRTWKYFNLNTELTLWLVRALIDLVIFLSLSLAKFGTSPKTSFAAPTGSLNFMKGEQTFSILNSCWGVSHSTRARTHRHTRAEREKTRSLTLNVHAWKWAVVEERWKSRNKYGKRLKKESDDGRTARCVSTPLQPMGKKHSRAIAWKEKNCGRFGGCGFLSLLDIPQPPTVPLCKQ